MTRKPEVKVSRIVIVEDSDVVRQRLEELLGSVPGNEVVGTAEGVQEALEVIWRTLPDAVILDLRLKDGSGMSVLELVKKTHPKMTVVVLTNHGTDEHRVKALGLGADRFLDKTADFDQIPAAVTP
ncbi:MAG TPA: response regulator transcription factor [Gemmatimonadales bacterium]